MARPARTPGRDPKRIRAEKAGRNAEILCALWLRLKGYRIRATRFKSHAGEIDIIAQKGKIIAAVEVKNRARHADALHAISKRQQQRIATALGQYARNVGYHGDLRFDVMTVGKYGRIRHLINAWHL
jgi:putative endonuclease